MIRLLCANINDLKNGDLEFHLGNFPLEIREEILRYKNVIDRKSRVLARLMLSKSMQETGYDFGLEAIKKGANNKPYLENWYEFNISHSGNLVLFAYGKQTLGIDIEHKLPINIDEITPFFSEEERIHITEAADAHNTFYTIWARKEALMKATGLGIGAGMHYSVNGDTVQINNESWNFKQLHIDPEYSSWLCVRGPVPNLTLEMFTKEMMDYAKKN